MPEQFRFTRNSPTLIAALTAEQINAVHLWQGDTFDFMFEFHTMHEAGWPCYLREPNGPNRGLPKINLLVYNGQLLQAGAVVVQANRAHFEAVIAANNAFFRTMARRFYEGVEVAPRVGTAGWYVCFTCENGGNQNPVYVRLPERGQMLGAAFYANMQRTAAKPTCRQHRNSNCMKAVVVQLTAQQALGKTSRFDENFEIVG